MTGQEGDAQGLADKRGVRDPSNLRQEYYKRISSKGIVDFFFLLVQLADCSSAVRE